MLYNIYYYNEVTLLPSNFDLRKRLINKFFLGGNRKALKRVGVFLFYLIMKKKVFNQKLNLKKETVVSLNGSQTSKIQGDGIQRTWSVVC